MIERNVCFVIKLNFWLDVGLCMCIFFYRVDYLDDDEYNYLMELYLIFFEGVEFRNGIVIFDCYVSVEFCGEWYGFFDLRSECLFYVIVFWVGVGG